MEMRSIKVETLMKLNQFTSIDSTAIKRIRDQYGTPLYAYDEKFIIDKCDSLMKMPNAYGLTVRYAMKANSNRTILRLIHARGLHIDASSLNEARRAHMAGIPYKDIMLTTQEVPCGDERTALEDMIRDGMRYNICSLRQLELIADLAKREHVDLSIRLHPGVGSGESSSRNTGDDYCCFGIHHNDIDKALSFAKENGLVFPYVHVHMGSGADPAMWRQNVDIELGLIEKYFKDAISVSFGGGLKEGRMPYETSADVWNMGEYAKKRLEEFYARTNRKLAMEIEPGTFIMANAGYVVARVIDMKSTIKDMANDDANKDMANDDANKDMANDGANKDEANDGTNRDVAKDSAISDTIDNGSYGNVGMNFVIADGGMEVNARPIMYASVHPFYVVSEQGELLSSEFYEDTLQSGTYKAAIIGKCCESGDSQSLDIEEHNIPRRIARPEIGDTLVIGGTGAYCSSMAPFNYNSHVQAPEVLYTCGGELRLIRKRQTLEQIVENEAC